MDGYNNLHFWFYTEYLILFISFSVLHKLKQEMATRKGEKQSQAVQDEGAVGSKAETRWVCDHGSLDTTFSLFGLLYMEWSPKLACDTKLTWYFVTWYLFIYILMMGPEIQSVFITVSKNWYGSLLYCDSHVISTQGILNANKYFWGGALITSFFLYYL